MCEDGVAPGAFGNFDYLVANLGCCGHLHSVDAIAVGRYARKHFAQTADGVGVDKAQDDAVAVEADSLQLHIEPREAGAVEEVQAVVVDGVGAELCGIFFLAVEDMDATVAMEGEEAVFEA